MRPFFPKRGRKRRAADQRRRADLECRESCRLLSAGDDVRERLIQAYAQLPLSFGSNVGQTDASVQFRARGAGSTLLLTPDEAVLSLSGATPGSGGVLRTRLEGADSSANVMGLDPLPATATYLIGSDPSRRQTGVPTCGQVAYPGINLVYHGNQQNLEYDFVVAPGADPGVTS
jgi:hypothetical protein